RRLLVSRPDGLHQLDERTFGGHGRGPPEEYSRVQEKGIVATGYASPQNKLGPPCRLPGKFLRRAVRSRAGTGMTSRKRNLGCMDWCGGGSIRPFHHPDADLLQGVIMKKFLMSIVTVTLGLVLSSHGQAGAPPGSGATGGSSVRKAEPTAGSHKHSGGAKS